MRLRWFPDNSVALIILPSTTASASAQQLCLMRSASVPIFFSHNHQARRVDSVEGGSSFMFWEVFFSAGGANTCADKGGLGACSPPPPPTMEFCKFRFSQVPFPAF